MNQPTNIDRADWGRQALNNYAAIIKSRDPHETLLIDLLSDLRHLADELGLDFEHAIDTSAMHHAEETGEVAR